jgi:hypothetical protein
MMGYQEHQPQRHRDTEKQEEEGNKKEEMQAMEEVRAVPLLLFAFFSMSLCLCGSSTSHTRLGGVKPAASAPG